MGEKHVFKNALFQLFAKLATSATTFFITLIVARNLGAAGYGDFTKVVVYVSLFYMVVDFGLNAIYLQDKKTFSFQTLFSTRVFIGLLLVIVANMVLVALPYNQTAGSGFSDVVKLGIFIFSFTILTQSLVSSASAVFQDKRRYQDLFVATLVGSAATILLVAGQLLGTFSLSSVFGAMTIGALGTALFALFLAQEDLGKISLANSKSLIIKSTPLGLMILFNLVYFRADVLLLSAYKTSFDVGVYGLAYRFFDFLVALPLFLSNALYPTLLEHAKNKRKINEIIKRYLVWATIISLGIIIISWFASPYFVLLKSDFVYATPVFRILLLSLPLFFYTSILQWGLIALRQQRYLLATYVVAGLLNIALNLVFIGKYSYTASAVITGVCEAVVLILLIAKAYICTKNIQNES